MITFMFLYFGMISIEFEVVRWCNKIDSDTQLNRVVEIYQQTKH